MPAFFFHLVFDLAKPRYTQIAEPTLQEKSSKLPESSVEGALKHTPQTFDDWRYGSTSIQTIAMAQARGVETSGERGERQDQITNGIDAGLGGLATKGKYEPGDPTGLDLGWGVVRLYRDADETHGLYDEPTTPSKHAKHSKAISRGSPNEQVQFSDEDCTILCILAVPSYFTPSDFLGFVGEKTREEVSHFRMIRTERGNRYMVLMKFRNGKKARQWRKEWNGKAFDGIEPENCHVVFVKSISFRLPSGQSGQTSSFPDMANDPFTPSMTSDNTAQVVTPSTHPVPNTIASSSTKAASRTLSKPAPPPTPSLIELPTCPVCLERMDESTGLLTILCQHVFHCSCLQKWKGSGCPVCRYTHSSLPLLHKGSHSYSTGEDRETGLNECVVCRSDTNLWICLICGSVGCGRYDAAHAFAHYESSGHCFAMELESQRVWDYASDVYVHRIIQDKTNGKFLDMTTANESDIHHGDDDHSPHGLDGENTHDSTDDYVPRSKLTSIGHEYTTLLTSQLDSQRLYFEEILHRAADKASLAASSAESAAAHSSHLATQLSDLQTAHSTILTDTIPTLERDRDRASKRADKFEAMARKLEREWRDEKALSGALMERIKRGEETVEELKGEVAELKDANRDLGFFIEAGQKLGGLGLGEEEVRGAEVSVPPSDQKEKGESGKRGKGGGNASGKGKK